MPTQVTEYFDWSGHVMGNPLAYPDVFVSIFLALDMDANTLEDCENVSKSWRNFIRGYLWQSARVMSFVDEKWSTGMPVMTESAVCRGEVRCFTGDDQVLLCGLYSGNIEVWTKFETEDGSDIEMFESSKKDRLLQRKTTLKDGHSGSVFCLALNSDIVVSGSFDHSVCVWDRERNFELLSRLKDRHCDMVYSVSVNQLNQFVSCSHDSTVSVWQFDKSNLEVNHMTSLCGHVSGVKAVDSDVTRIVTASRDRTLKVWSFPNGNEVTNIRLAGSPSCVSLLWPQVAVGLKSSFFGDDQVYFDRHIIRLYNLESGLCTRVMHGHESRILILKLDPFSKRMVSGDASGHLLIWPQLKRSKMKDKDSDSSTFDDNEMPSNILLLGSCKVAGLVLGFTGLQVALQKGTLMALDFLQ